ncbi:hypothetical protein B9Z55_026025 [Caenorhabditis nigoni]|nr:hypothetical protein B9Z55_026025 [Caenorhabditis nigoni]
MEAIFRSLERCQIFSKCSLTGHLSKDIQCKMSGIADLTEFILTTYILQPNFPIDQIKDIISQIPMASTLRKKCEMAIAFREGRLTDIMTIGKSMMGLGISNGYRRRKIQRQEQKENLDSVVENSLEYAASRSRLSDFSQRLKIENLKPANSSLPAAPYMAMELFTRTKMNGRTRMGEEKKKLRRSVNEQYQEYASMPDKEREEMDAKIRFQQEEIRLDNVEDREIERERETAGQKAITVQKKGNKKNKFFWGVHILIEKYYTKFYSK